MSSFVVLYLGIWKGLLILTEILVIASIKGMCILLLHWSAIRELTELILNVQKYSDK